MVMKHTTNQFRGEAKCVLQLVTEAVEHCRAVRRGTMSIDPRRIHTRHR